MRKNESDLIRKKLKETISARFNVSGGRKNEEKRIAKLDPH